MKDKNTKQSQTQDICFEVRATALIPAFTAVKGFHYPPRTLTRSTKDQSIELHHLQELYRRVIFTRTRGTQGTKVITTRSLNSLQFSLFYNFLID